MFVPCMNGEHDFVKLDNGNEQCMNCGLVVIDPETPHEATCRTFAEQEGRGSLRKAPSSRSDGL